MIFDPVYLIFVMLPVAILGGIAQWRVMSTFKKFSQIPVATGLTGAQVAERILQRAGINDVSVERIDSFLGDHYDPGKKVLCLSPDVYDSHSVSSVGVAAHECGHALQHQQHYVPLHFRMAIVTPTLFASQLLPFVIIGGIWLHIMGFLYLAVAIYAVIAFFQLVTLPVEFDASHRAKQILSQMAVINREEAEGVNKVLNAAAFTYVAALIASLANLLYFVLRAQSRRD